MYTLFETIGWQPALRREAVPLLLALVTAEVFYKFHSFVLECVAFLATWYAFSWVGGRLMRR